MRSSATLRKLRVMLDFGHTLIFGLSVHNALGHTLLTATTLDTNTVNAIALLCLVSEMTGFVRASWAGGTVNGRQLTVLPSADTRQEPQCVCLFLAPELFKVFVGPHIA